MLITQYVTSSNLINLYTYSLLSINPRYYQPCQLAMSIIDDVSKMSGKYLAHFYPSCCALTQDEPRGMLVHFA